MKRISRLMVLAGITTLTGACNFFTQPGDLQTESLQNEIAQTQIAAVRATATVYADRLMVTLENAQTAVGNVDLQSTRIASTLIASGMAFVDASGITPVAATPATPAQQGDSDFIGSRIANPLLTPGVPQVSSQGSAQGDSSLMQTTPTPPPQQQVDPNAPTLVNISLTETVGSDDCAVNPTNRFSSGASDIYAVATARNVAADTLLNATFSLEGQVIQSYDWTPGFEMNGVCIWFHMPADEVTFTPGNWSVTFSVNGTTVGTPLPFTIEGDTPSEIDVMSETGG